MLRPVLIRLSDPTLVPNLCAHFLRSGFDAESAGGSMAAVSRPDAPNAEQERREIEMHLRIWSVGYSDVGADLVDE